MEKGQVVRTAVHSADTRIIPIQKPNQARMVTKLADGGMRVELNSGVTFDLGADDELFQTFVVYTMLNSETRVLS